MADLDKKLGEIRTRVMKAGHVLEAHEKVAEIADILNGLTRPEIEELAMKSFQLDREAATSIERVNLMEVATHILTYFPGGTDLPPSGPNDGGDDTPPSGPRKAGDIPKFAPPKPTDPDKNPDDVLNDHNKKPDFEKKRGVGKGNKIHTRGQKIDVKDKLRDDKDYEKEYPGKGEIAPAKEVAVSILHDKRGIFAEDHSIIQTMQEQGKSRDDVLAYMEGRINQQRREAEMAKEKRQFSRLFEESCVGIKGYMEKTFSKEIADKMSQFPDPKRIHIVDTYDYMNITDHETALGVFRSEEGDVYISKAYLDQFTQAPAIGKNAKGEFPRVLREIKHILIHEMIHSMSALNYRVSEETKTIGTRRLGLVHVNYVKGIFRGYGMNEAITENLTQKVLNHIYVDTEGLQEYQPQRTSYPKEQAIIGALIQDNPELKWEDFSKAMLIRKYGDEKDLKGPTPIVELLRKMNQGKELKNAKYPNFYEIIMSLTDYVVDNNRKKSNLNIDWILDFIKTKDITILERAIGKSLYKDVFDKKRVLNAAGTNFNDLILEKYSAK